MKRYMMSDIHGFLEAFEAALKKTDLSGKNQLISAEYTQCPKEDLLRAFFCRNPTFC